MCLGPLGPGNVSVTQNSGCVRISESYKGLHIREIQSGLHNLLRCPLEKMPIKGGSTVLFFVHVHTLYTL